MALGNCPERVFLPSSPGVQAHGLRSTGLEYFTRMRGAVFSELTKGRVPGSKVDFMFIKMHRGSLSRLLLTPLLGFPERFHAMTPHPLLTVKILIEEESQKMV